VIKRETTQNEPLLNVTEGLSLLQLIQNVNDQYNVVKNEEPVDRERAQSKKRMN
jgi:hypothetical protein